MTKISAVILAAGKGTRMHSTLPKVLHKIAHKSMIEHVIDSVKSLSYEQIYVIYGHGRDHITKALSHQPIKLVYQNEQLGTAHAVMQALPHIQDDEDILILYGDTPLISHQTLNELIKHKPANGIALLTAFLADPTGYGRIVRENGQITAIVEHKDASDEQLKINEINTGIMLVTGADLKKWLSKINNNNAQKEFYLTDIIEIAQKDGANIISVHPSFEYEIKGVNNRLQQAELERIYQLEMAKKIMASGVTLTDPNRFDLRGELCCGQDVIIDNNVIIEGNVTIGSHVTIGANCILKNCVIGDNSVISPFSVIENSTINANCTVGPFARLRPGSQLDENVHVGNFVEIKNAHLGKATKAGHLSYLGDSQIGENVNIGAGTITCNYDGVNKHKTVIEDDVFVGSDSQLIAPVTIAKGATIAAGTTVTANVEQNELAISRVKQRTIANWKKPVKHSK